MKNLLIIIPKINNGRAGRITLFIFFSDGLYLIEQSNNLKAQKKNSKAQ
jgi:hypothetical protein